jgi:arylsulfatase A-like enzyme
MKGGKSAWWKDEDIADRLTEKALGFIEKNKDNPFFLYFATHDIHVPRYPNPRFVGKSGLGLRGDAILEFDWSVGEVMKKLEELGISNNTLIILSSDNGPVLDDGYQDRAVELIGNHKPSGKYRGGKYSIYEAGTRVPCIVSWPSKVKKNKTSNALISHIDLFASLAALTGQQLADETAGDSFDQLDAWLGKDKKGRDFAIEDANCLSILQHGYKFIEFSTLKRKGIENKDVLYDLKKDISEKINIADSNPLIMKEMGENLAKIKSTPCSRKMVQLSPYKN